MAPAPKPVSLTNGANPTPGVDPQPLIVVGGVPITTAILTAALKGLSGYSASASQTLTNDNGTLKWVTNP